MKNKKLLLGILLLALLAILVVVSNVLRLNRQVRDLKVEITYGAYTAVPKDNQKAAPGVDLSRRVDTLLTAPTLRRQMLKRSPTMLSVKVKEVDREAVEAVALKSPYVESAQASTNVWGDIVVRVVQRTPVLRLFGPKGESYLSHDGRLMPLSREGEADVPVAVGNHAKELLPLAVWLYDNPLYGALFDQLALRPDGDLVLAPRVGDHLVVLGTMENVDAKMADLLAFYRKGLNQVGWNTYREIILKYNGQIVCR